jgi:hypothetical protein
MALDDFLDSEVGIAVAATAIVMSPRVRGFLRRGAVYGLAGAMRAGDVLSNAAQGVASQAQSTAASAMAEAQSITDAGTDNETERKPRSRGGRSSRSSSTE